MPTRAKKKALPPTPSPEPEVAAEDEDEVVEEEREEIPLKFKHSLIGRPGKPLTSKEIYPHLRSLLAELRELDQYTAPLERIKEVVVELCNDNVIEHRDKGVQALVACCIADILRLTAPDAPLTKPQMKAFFTILVDDAVLTSNKSAHPSYGEYIDLIRSVVDSRIHMLLIDTSEAMVSRLFSNVFDVVSEGIPLNSDAQLMVKNSPYLLQLLTPLIEEMESIPNIILDLIIAQFLRADPTAKGIMVQVVSEIPPAYAMAKRICTSCPVPLARAISQYFSTVLLAASDTEDISIDLHSKSGKKKGKEDGRGVLTPLEPSVTQLKELSKAHKLIRELWKAAPEVIQEVIRQLEVELSAQHIAIRVMAVETIGDMIAGIGAAGFDNEPSLDPQAYPSQSIAPPIPRKFDIFKTPSATHAFSTLHPTIYSAFVARIHDRSHEVRCAISLAFGRILRTNAGGMGLDHGELKNMLDHMSELLQDGDERVRLTAVRTLATFSYQELESKLRVSGPVEDKTSILYRLSERIKDRKRDVRKEAMVLLGHIWGVAAGAICQGVEDARALFGGIPSKIFEAFYVGDPEIDQNIYDVLFSSLLPLNYPRLQDTISDRTDGKPQKSKANKNASKKGIGEAEGNIIRAVRIIHLVNELGEKAAPVFFSMQRSQTRFANLMETYIKLAEEHNGKFPKVLKGEQSQMDKVVGILTKRSPDIMTAVDHLWKFAKINNRRVNALIRYAMEPESSFKKASNSIKEIVRRLDDPDSGCTVYLQTLLPLLYQSSPLIFNRSHIPTILEYANTGKDDLGHTAHSLLTNIASSHPEVFKAHVRTMCNTIIESTPKQNTECEESVVQTLKACAGFAQKYPSEMPQDEKLRKSMVNYVLFGSPAKVGKYAVSIIASNESAGNSHLEEIVEKSIEGFKVKSPGYLTKLTALSQALLVANANISEETDNKIQSLVAEEILMKLPDDIEPSDDEWRDEVDEDTEARSWAMRILVNRVRGQLLSKGDDQIIERRDAQSLTRPVFYLLYKMFLQNSGMVIVDNTSVVLPEWKRSRHKLIIAKLILKLCATKKDLDTMCTAIEFDEMIPLTQHAVETVRSEFVKTLKKYLAHARIAPRFYVMLFMLAFEPKDGLRDGTLAWLKARAATAARPEFNPSGMEMLLTRLLNALTHHPDFQDFSLEANHLDEVMTYIVYYLRAVATADNISLIHLIALKIKTIQDTADDKYNNYLYCLAEISQAVIREFAEIHNWQITSYTGKVTLPGGIYNRISDREKTAEVAHTRYSPEGYLEDLPEKVKSLVKIKKRKAGDNLNHSTSKAKKAKIDADVEVGSGQKKTPIKSKTKATPTTSRASKTPKKSNGVVNSKSSPVVTSATRRSTRVSNIKNYAETAGSGDDDDEGGDEDVQMGDDDVDDIDDD